MSFDLLHLEFGRGPLVDRYGCASRAIAYGPSKVMHSN